MKNWFCFALIFTGLVSCNNVTVTNLPSEPEKEFPAFLRGEFELIFPEAMASMMSAVDSTAETPLIKVRINASSFTTITDQGSNINLINDSTFVCKVKSDYYLCMGREPSLSIFKIVDKTDSLNLFPMFIMGQDTKAADLKKYFSAVKNDPEAEGNFIVTVNPKKLKKFFDGPLPYKDPFVLKRIK